MKYKNVCYYHLPPTRQKVSVKSETICGELSIWYFLFEDFIETFSKRSSTAIYTRIIYEHAVNECLSLCFTYFITRRHSSM